jgi:inner membrane transporter RhtA
MDRRQGPRPHHPGAVRAARAGARTAAPVSLAVVSMLSVQLGDALSVGLFDEVGTAGAAWLRLTIGALVVLAVARPRRLSLDRRQWVLVAALGVTSAGLSLAFFAALQRLPLGTTVALEFLGPLVVALCRAPRRAAMAWPLVALGGVVLLTQPGGTALPRTGVLLALLAAACWAGYILLTARVGSALPGFGGLALSMPVAALCAAPWGAPQVLGHVTPGLLLTGALLALLFPVLPSLLELVVLRRLPAGSFATLMSLEPALAVVVGAVVLGQLPTVLQLAGIALVVVAGAAVTRPTRAARSTDDPAPVAPAVLQPAC